MLVSLNIELPRSLYLNMQRGKSVAMFTGRSSQPRPRSRLFSQKHHGAELNSISIHLSGYGGVHTQVKWIIQPTGSIILAWIKKFYQIINTPLEDGPRLVIHLSSSLACTVLQGIFIYFTLSNFVTKSYGILSAHAQSTKYLILRRSI